MEETNKQIRYCQWGLANFYDNYIEINEGLKENKKVRDWIVNHEKGHKNSFDIGHELNILGMPISLIWFFITHPRTWIDLSPIQHKNKIFLYDLNLIILYVILSIVGYFAWKVYLMIF